MSSNPVFRTPIFCSYCLLPPGRFFSSMLMLRCAGCFCCFYCFCFRRVPVLSEDKDALRRNIYLALCRSVCLPQPAVLPVAEDFPPFSVQCDRALFPAAVINDIQRLPPALMLLPFAVRRISCLFLLTDRNPRPVIYHKADCSLFFLHMGDPFSRPRRLIAEPGELSPESEQPPVIVHKIPVLPGLFPVQPVYGDGGIVGILQPVLCAGKLLA